MHAVVNSLDKAPFLRCAAIDGKKGAIYEGKPREGATAQVTITVDDDDFVDLATGKANAPAVRTSVRGQLQMIVRVRCFAALRQR